MQKQQVSLFIPSKDGREEMKVGNTTVFRIPVRLEDVRREGKPPIPGIHSQNRSFSCKPTLRNLQTLQLSSISRGRSPGGQSELKTSFMVESPSQRSLDTRNSSATRVEF